MANIILPQVNILNEINDSATMLVEQNGEINRFNIADLDIGGGDVTIDLENSNISKPNPVNADTLGGCSPEEYIALANNYTNQQIKKAAPRNLLDNSDFRNPVNQRGQTNYVNNNNTIDRWLIWNTNNDPSLTVNNGNITVNAGSTGAVLQQRFPKGFLDSNKQYTAVVRLVNGSVNAMDVTFDNTYDAVNYYMDAGSLHDIEWAALYEGEYTIDTLPEYQPKGYGAEFRECQRYYQVYIEMFIGGMTFNPGNGYRYSSNIAIPKMRIIPTVLIEKSGTYGSYESAEVDPKAASIMINVVSNNTTESSYAGGYFTLRLSADL